MLTQHIHYVFYESNIMSGMGSYATLMRLASRLPTFLFFSVETDSGCFIQCQ